MVDAVIFDLDGTLIDSVENIYGFLRALCDHDNKDFEFQKNKNQHPIKSSKDMKKYWEEPYWKNFVNLGYQWPKHKVKLREFFQNYRENNMPKLVKGIRKDLLDRLMRFPKLKLGVVTSSPPKTTKLTLKENNLEGLFNVIISDDDTWNPKPAPDYIVKAVTELKVDPRHTIYIGDLPSDIQAAKAAQCQAIGVRWGFGSNKDLIALEKRVAISPRVVYDMIGREIKKRLT